MEIYTIAGIKAKGTMLKGIQNQQINPQLEELVLSGSGVVEAGFAAVDKINPQILFTTSAIKTALGALGDSNGIIIAADLDLWLQKTANGGMRQAGATHTKIACALGLITPQVLRIPSGGNATLDYITTLTSSDGLTSPIIVTPNQALDIDDGPAGEAYVLGDVSLNGTTLEGASDVELTFGLTVDTTNLFTYPTHAFIVSRRVILKIRTFDVGAWESWGASGSNWLEGQAQDASDSIITLDDYVAGGARGTSPITVAVDDGRMHFNSLGGSDGEKFVGEVTVTAVWDGTADVLVWTGLA